MSHQGLCHLKIMWACLTKMLGKPTSFLRNSSEATQTTTFTSLFSLENAHFS